MTLQELFDLIGQNPNYVIFYFSLLPFAALLGTFLDGDRGHTSPWKYIYSVLIYLVSIPGLFALTLNIYFFLFEQQHSVMEMDLVLQVLPIVSMVLTLLVIRNNMDMRHIPGFNKLSGLLMLITAVLGIMWIIDRTHLIAFIRLRFEVVIIIFIALLLMMRFGFKRVFGA
jgi:hypothetical protein